LCKENHKKIGCGQMKNRWVVDFFGNVHKMEKKYHEKNVRYCHHEIRGNSIPARPFQHQWKDRIVNAYSAWNQNDAERNLT
jgi:hypothetical protein